MRWEEIEESWEAMTRRMRADRPAIKPGYAPTQTAPDKGREKVTTDARSDTGVREGSIP